MPDFENTKGEKTKDKFIEITQKAIAKYRENLLDISNRNNLINLNFNPRSNKILRIIDELPNVIAKKLAEEKTLRLISLPPPEKEPKDEKTDLFKKTFEEEKLINEEFLNEVEHLGDKFDDSNEISQQIIRKLKDYVREKLNLKKRPSPETMSIEEYAKAHNIMPNYEVPKNLSENISENKHADNKMQTLFYPDDLARKARALKKDTKRILDEKGTNTLHISFGCLEWFEAANVKRHAPLLLMQVQLSENSTLKGPEYLIESTQSEIFLNLPISKKLLNDFRITLPEYKDNLTPEDYFTLIENNILKNKPDWKLRRYITLAIHTYSKMSMYEELDPSIWSKNGNILGKQENIKSLFTGSKGESGFGETYDVDDKKINSKVPILIEETDSSQFSTIVDAMNGNNLAIQGPPGTGKSTTITNMIAAFLYKKKKVLFVAEKKAALDVVFKKLKDKNLDKFAFRLSSTAEKKTSILDELKKRLELDQPFLDFDIENDEKEYNKQKKLIRDYGDILQKEYFEIKKTGYEILTNVSKYKYYLDKYPKYFENDPSLKNIEKLTRNDYIKNLTTISDLNNILQNITKSFKDITQHPWFGLTLDNNNPYEIKELKNDIINIKIETENLIKKTTALYKEIHFNGEINSNNLDKLIKVFNIAENIKSKEISDILSILVEEKYIDKFKDFHHDLKLYNDFDYVKKSLEKTVELGESFEIVKLKRHLKNIKNSVFLFSFLFSTEYRNSKRYFTYIVKDGLYKKEKAIVVINNLINYLTLKKNTQKNINSLKNNYSYFAKKNNNFKSEKTDFKIIDNVKKYLIFEKIDEQILINKNIKNLTNIKKEIKSIEVIYNAFKNLYNKFSSKIDSQKFFKYEKNNIVFGHINPKLNKIDLTNDEVITDYITLNNYNNNFDKDFQNLYDSFVSEKIDFKFLEYSYKFLVFNSLARKLFNIEKNLPKFLSTSFDQEVKKLRDLDKKVFKNKKFLLINNLLNISIEPGISRGKATDLTERALIEREIDKKRAHIPFRQLLKRAGKALRDMKPCYMLSPTSLSQIVSAEPEIFDVLIIDEASQMKIEDSIGAILRTKQTIIVGDPMQLPPTTFFNTAADFSTEDGIVDDDESILDLALSKYHPSRMLKWHYRSKHESLINFSNHHFYNRQLIIPPSATDEFAIKNNYIEDGIYTSRTTTETKNIKERGGVNLIEANKISEAVINFMINCVKKKQKKSCLLVTMNNQQRDLIDEQIRFLSSKSNEANDYISSWMDTMESFEVKNLERVQGDERDVIFISTLFGPNKDNHVMERFGPIVQARGERRLNVLFTRAKERVELFTSLTPNRIKDGGAKGKEIFKRYLEYAKIQRIETGVDTGKSTDSDFEDWVKEELEKLGYQVIPQVGVSGFFIDLGIKHEDYKYGYLAGIECDGAAYHSSVSARDNDIVRQKVLEGLGWNIYRIWSTNWFDNPKSELKKLDLYLKTLLKEIQKKY